MTTVTLPTYPGGSLDDRRQVAALIGPFWTGVYPAPESILAYAEAVADGERQVYQDLDETAAGIGRRTCPLYALGQWRLLLLRRSLATTYTALYGDPGIFFGSGLFYGGGSGERWHAWPLPTGITDAALACSRIGADVLAGLPPPAMLASGTDFTCNAALGLLAFRLDPTVDPRFSVRFEYDAAGNVTDAVAAVWLFGVSEDTQQLANNHGYVLGLRLPSSPGNAALLNEAMDAAVGGGTAETADGMLAAMAGIPVAGGVETVEIVTSDNRGLVIVTNAAVYRYGAAAAPLVAVGDVTQPGQPLTDGLLIADLNSGVPPAWLTMLAMTPDFLVGPYTSDLVFRDLDVPLEVTFDNAGNTRVAFAVDGLPADVQHFWDDVHARGLAQGKTLAQYLDRRPHPVGQPTAASLPAIVNPLHFLVANLLRCNTAVARVNVGAGNDDAAGLGYSYLLRELLPAPAAILILFEMPVVTGEIDAEMVGSTTQPGTSWTLGSWSPAPVMGDSLGEANLSSSFAGRIVAGP